MPQHRTSAAKLIAGDHSSRPFIFCTGVENSYPVITDRDGKSIRRDGMELSGHYQHWRHDLDLVKSLGLRYLRYGPPYYQCSVGPQRYDWSFADKTFEHLRKLQITPITDLCHFGVPDWIENFQNPDWPLFYAEYAAAFAERFPWVRFYTPMNEIFTCADFSGKRGWWNEREKSDRAFVTTLKHMAKANLLAEQAILKVRPDALFVQSESSSAYHAATPEAQACADFFNERRYLALDLCYGHDVSAMMLEFLLDNGMTREEYRWFMATGPQLRPHCIMGSDYYGPNEKTVTNAQGDHHPSGEVLGYYPINKAYFERYHLPIMHTETNLAMHPEQAPHWLMKEWFNVLQMKNDGIPILGFTWYSLLDQTDWDSALREVNHRCDENGLFDLQRKIRPVGTAYQQLIANWQNHLPLQSLSRDIVADPPGEESQVHKAQRHRNTDHSPRRRGVPSS